ncbi:MAG TPA: N-acetyl-gamma-glutamyl-phosphate reductase, partial [Myxococcota bacterium]|nr:N-acetyl-gamma-glutamyl-phosphate reductase [Myxococcota bacterium]
MIRVAVLGASGYTGAELCRLVAGHPHLRVTSVSARRAAGQHLASVFGHLRGVPG